MGLVGWERVGRNDQSYKACVAVTTAGGAIAGGVTGSFLGPAGTLTGYAGGAAWGLTIGYLACPYLVPALKRKIESSMPLSEAEVRSAAEAMGRYAGVREATDAVRLLGMVRTCDPSRRIGGACGDPAATARQLLGRV